MKTELIGLCGLLVLAFIVLKMCGVIAWDWWWVLSPAWGLMSFAIGFWVPDIILERILNVQK